MILDDFKRTVEKIISNVREELTVVYPLNHLEKCYNEVYGLNPIRSLLKEKANTNLLSEQLKLMMSPKKVSRLKETNDLLNDINIRLNQIVTELSELISNFKKSVLIVKKELADKARLDLGKHFSSDEIIYGVVRTSYTGGKNIAFEGGWIQFPFCPEDSFKPWVYSEKGFIAGVHKLKIICSKPSRSTNCGIGIIKESDLQTYPYSIYKSLYDRVTREFKLVCGS